LGTLTSQGVFPQVPENKKLWKEEVNKRDKLQELETKLNSNEYIDERQTLANTWITREGAACVTRIWTSPCGLSDTN